MSIRGNRWFTVPVAAVVASTVAFGWGNVGHRVVATIAVHKITAKARQNVGRILGVPDPANPAALASAMADAAVWPDEVARARYPVSRAWHFIDMSLKNGPNDVPDPFSSQTTAFGKLVKFSNSLQAGQSDELEPGSDLKFLIHLVGDIHQPNHCSTNQDRGGNCLFVVVDDDREKLHGVWDTGIIESRIGTNSAGVATRLLNRYDKLSDSEKEVLEGPPDAAIADLVKAWILESHNLAATDVYGPLRPPVPRLSFKEVKSDCSNAARAIRKRTWVLDSAYVEAAQLRIEKQLIAGGVRLAALLNRIWPAP